MKRIVLILFVSIVLLSGCALLGTTYDPPAWIRGTWKSASGRYTWKFTSDNVIFERVDEYGIIDGIDFTDDWPYQPETKTETMYALRNPVRKDIWHKFFKDEGCIVWVWGQEWPLDDITTVLYPSVGPPGDDDDEIEYEGFFTTAFPPGGTYTGPQEIELIVTHDHDPNVACFNGPGAVVITYYTTDNTVPYQDDTIYTGPILIENDTILRFRSHNGKCWDGAYHYVEVYTIIE